MNPMKEAESTMECTLCRPKSCRQVSCNPLGQAEQVKAAMPDLIVEMGLCLGHDILFRAATAGIPSTTLVVKDRTNGHAPIESIRRIGAQETEAPSP